MNKKSSKKQPTKKTTYSRGLEARRDVWQTTALFDPEQALNSLPSRYEQGKALRKQTPRESHAAWTSATDRADLVATVLASNVGREEA